MNFPKENTIEGGRLAFSITVHDYPGIFEILLHLIFRPYNFYCIFIDAKTESKVKSAFHELIK